MECKAIPGRVNKVVFLTKKQVNDIFNPPIKTVFYHRRKNLYFFRYGNNQKIIINSPIKLEFKKGKEYYAQLS